MIRLNTTLKNYDFQSIKVWIQKEPRIRHKLNSILLHKTNLLLLNLIQFNQLITKLSY